MEEKAMETKERAFVAEHVRAMDICSDLRALMEQAETAVAFLVGPDPEANSDPVSTDVTDAPSSDLGPQGNMRGNLRGCLSEASRTIDQIRGILVRL